MVWSVLASGFQKLLSSFFMLLCLPLYHGPPAAVVLVVRCSHYLLPHRKKEAHENVGMWACFPTEIFLRAASLWIHEPLWERACVKSVYLIKLEVVFLEKKSSPWKK